MTKNFDKGNTDSLVSGKIWWIKYWQTMAGAVLAIARKYLVRKSW